MTKFGRCCICTSSFTIADVTSLKCGHTFHAECIKNWINNSKTCPHCRKKTVQRDLVKLFFDEADISFTQSQNDLKDDAASLKKIEDITRRLMVAEENNQKLLGTFEEFQQKLKSLKSELKTAKAKAGTLAVKEECIRQLEARLFDQTELNDQLERMKARVRASEFFAYLTKRGERDSEKAIDGFLTKSGDVDAQRFIELIEGQNKKLNDNVKRLESELELLKRQNYEKTEKSRKAKQIIADQKNEIDNLRARLDVAEKTRMPLRTLDGNNQTLSAARPKKSFGFSFVDESCLNGSTLSNATSTIKSVKCRTLADIADDVLNGAELSADDAPATMAEVAADRTIALLDSFDVFDAELSADDNVPVASSVMTGALSRKAALPKRKVFADRFNKSIDILDELEFRQRERSPVRKTSVTKPAKSGAKASQGIKRFLSGELGGPSSMRPQPAKRTSTRRRIIDDDDEVDEMVDVVTPDNDVDIDRQQLLMAPRAPKARQSVRSAAAEIIMLD